MRLFIWSFAILAVAAKREENQLETVAKRAVQSELDNDLQSAVGHRRKRREDSLLGHFFMKNLKANFTKTISRIEEQLIPGLSSRFGSQSAVTKELKHELNSLKIEKLASQISNLSSGLGDLGRQLENVQQQMTDEIHQLTLQLTNATNLIHQEIETIQQKQSELANLTEENGQEINVLRTNLTDDLQRLDQKLNSTHEEQLELTSRVQDQLTTQVTRFTNDFGTLNQKVRTLQQGQTSLVSRDRALDGKIEQVKQYGHGNRGRIDQLTTKVTRNTNDLRTQISNVRTLQQGQSTLTSKDVALDRKIEQVKQYGHGNSGRINQLTTKVTRNTNDLRTQISNVRTLQQGQTTSVSRGRALDGKIEQIKRYTRDIKLRPIDSNYKKGILMVKYQGQWGTVCDDEFGSNEARSACHSLGFSGGSFINYNAGLTATILMDNVSCSSTTQNFLTCSHGGWGTHNCNHNEDVLLTCS